MKIGIFGTGHIGKTLVRKLSAAGHDVKVANSRGPDTIEADVLAFGGRAVTAAEAVADVDVVILSIPLNRIPGDRAADRQRASRDGRHRHVELLSAARRQDRRHRSRSGREPVGGRTVGPAGRQGMERHRVRLFREEGQSLRGARTASPSPSRPTAKRIARWEWRSSRTPGSTPSMRARLRTRGGSSPARPATARTSPARRCRPRWQRPSGAIAQAARPGVRGSRWNGSGTARRTRTRTTLVRLNRALFM